MTFDLFKDTFNEARMEGKLECKLEGKLEGEKIGLIKGEKSGLIKGERRGVILCRIEGTDSANKEWIKKLFDKDFSIDEIIDISGLSYEKILETINSK